MANKYPTLTRFNNFKEESGRIAFFLEWAWKEKGLRLASEDDGQDSAVFPDEFTLRNLLAEFYNLDLDAVEKERFALLNALVERVEADIDQL